MITVEIPGRETLLIDNIIMDFNGTIAEDGRIPERIKDRLEKLSSLVNITVITADTNGTAKEECGRCNISVYSHPVVNAGKLKADILKKMEGNSATIGNGFNDIDMFRVSAFSVGVIGIEGMCPDLLSESDIVVNSIDDALDLFLKPSRIRATLRS